MNHLHLSGCVILKEHAILLLHRIKRDWYELPGGKIENGETPEQAAVRELKEELCCDVQIIQHLGKRSFTDHELTMSYTWFLAKIKAGQIPSIGEPDTFDHFRYIPLDALETVPLSFNMQNFQAAYQNGDLSLLQNN